MEFTSEGIMRIVPRQIEVNDLEFMEQQFSQDYMAKKLNISQAAYSKIEVGMFGFSAFRLRHIFKILGIDPHIIIAPILEGRAELS